MTEPKVFIIESLGFKDEKKDLFEGRVLSNILKLNDVESEYYYIRTKQEFEEVIDIFYDSNFRYLHISCHGSPSSLETTLDSISFDELHKFLSPCLVNRRVFISACEMVNLKLAKALINGSKCLSVIGPSKPVAFSDATIFWSSFYHLMFSNNSEVMKKRDLKNTLSKVANLFNVSVNYYSKSKVQGIRKSKYPSKST